MSPKNRNKLSESLESIREQILKLSVSDYTKRLTISGDNDDLDSICIALNSLADVHESKEIKRRKDKQRLNNILEILLDYSVMDFSRKAEIGHEGDEFDALAAGLNMLAQELEYAISSQNKFAKELIKANSDLAENNEKIFAVFNNTPDAIMTTDLSYQITEWNKAAEQMYGYTREEAIGKKADKIIFSEPIPPHTFEESRKEMRTKGIWRGELWQSTPTREKMLIYTVSSYLRNADGVPIGFLGVNRDITRMRKTEEDILHKTEELKRSNTELEQFAYVASHDLQEPLRMITSYVQLLEKQYKDKLDENANEFINFAVDGASRMQTLIYSLLEYSRINRIQPFEWTNLDETLNEVLKDLKVTIKETNAKIIWDNLPMVFADKVLIGQLFFNLIANAIKFRSADPPEIDIKCEKRDNEFIFAVKDNGIGIKKEYADKIFVIFQRLHSKDKYPGTGIGLSICKKIIERHEGRIWVESEIGKGSTFFFTIKSNLINRVKHN